MTSVVEARRSPETERRALRPNDDFRPFRPTLRTDTVRTFWGLRDTAHVIGRVPPIPRAFRAAQVHVTPREYPPAVVVEVIFSVLFALGAIAAAAIGLAHIFPRFAWWLDGMLYRALPRLGHLLIDDNTEIEQ